MSDSNFINAYNEVILENLNAIMKQNFMFQTQIKFLEQRVNDIPEMEKKLADFEKNKSVELKELVNTTGDFERRLSETSAGFEKKLSDKQDQYNHLMDEKNSLTGEVRSLREELNIKNQSNVAIENDKHRLQTAVNQQAGEIENLKNTIGSLEKEIDSQKKYNSQLEDMLPNSKKKKLSIDVPEETPKVEVKKEKTALNNVTPLNFELAGGTF